MCTTKRRREESQHGSRCVRRTYPIASSARRSELQEEMRNVIISGITITLSLIVLLTSLSRGHLDEGKEYRPSRASCFLPDCHTLIFPEKDFSEIELYYKHILSSITQNLTEAMEK